MPTDDRIMFRCHAEGRPGDWEAICLDLDIAVQGESFDDVKASLEKAVRMHVNYAKTLPENERAALLNRPVPARVWLRSIWLAIRTSLSRRWQDGKDRAEFTMHCPA